MTWALENFPVWLMLVVLAITQPKLSRFTLIVLLLHALVLMVGGHYTYAKVPAGFWVQDLLNFSRNPYDRLGHFMQGFSPAILLYELLSKKSLLKASKLLPLIVISFCLAFSALYELFEWAAAMTLGQGADEFLGTQGDPWDTQSDMFMALIGASLAVALFQVKKSKIAA